MSQKFTDFDLNDKIQVRLNELGFIEPTPIQAQSLPISLEGKDVIGKAETGTGKTLAFSLPLLQKIDPTRQVTQALILSPTRELATQIRDALAEFEEALGIRTVAIIGGESQAKQIMDMHKGCAIIVGTPGRVFDMLSQGCLNLGWCKFLVLDEADRMLDMGFVHQVESILERTSQERQTLLFSATVDKQLQKISKRHMKTPVLIETSSGLKTSENIDQKYVVIDRHDKIRLLAELLDVSKGVGTIVFANTKRIADMIGKELWVKGYKALHLHGDIDQDVRQKVLSDFKSGGCDILVATDVAQRGIDVQRVERVINYEVPLKSESYVHRIGRCGRAGRKGTVLTLVEPQQKFEFNQIKKHIGDALVQLPIPSSYRSVDLNSPVRKSERSSWRDRKGSGGSRSGGHRGKSRNSSRGRPQRKAHR